MGALRRIRHRSTHRPGKRPAHGPPSRTRGRRLVLAASVAAAAALGATACDPVDGQINTSAVAITTDETGTKELERQGVDVSWLSCTAGFEDRVTPQTDSATSDPVVKVDCQGETADGTDITIKGRVYSVVDGACVRGNLTARVGNKEWFRVDVLGDCESGGDNGDGNDSSGGNDNGGSGNGGNDGGQPSQEPSHEEPQPGPTTTVTVTAPPEHQPQPTCNCVPGK